MINKYTELHEQLMTHFTDYHNFHVKFVGKQTGPNLNKMVKELMRLSKTIKSMRSETRLIRKEIQARRETRLQLLKEKENDNSNN